MDSYLQYLPELLPCPFCYGKAMPSYNGSDRYIRCTERSCGIRGPMINFHDHKNLNNIECYQLAANKWNDRKNYEKKI